MELQQVCHRQAVDKGFHEETFKLIAGRGIAEFAEDQERLDAERALRNYQANKLMLIVSEAVEAHDELRHGRDVRETYYSEEAESVELRTLDEVVRTVEKPRKPEGVPSELADIVIRTLDFAGAWGIDLASAIEEKLAYNRTRSRLHGKEF